MHGPIWPGHSLAVPAVLCLSKDDVCSESDYIKQGLKVSVRFYFYGFDDTDLQSFSTLLLSAIRYYKVTMSISKVAHRNTQLANRRAGLPAAKRERLEEALQRAVAPDFKPEIISRRPILGPALLSFAQQRLWFLDRLELGRPLYNLPVGVRLTGRLNIAGLGQSINEIIRRHEALRTNFAVEGEEPVQVIAVARHLNLPFVDLSGLPIVESQAQARRLALEESRRPYDLEKDSLLRVTLLRLAERQYVVLLTMHHIVSDGWSMGIFIGEMGKLYAAYCVGAESPLADLPIQYADFSYWQRQWLQGKVLEAEIYYWKQQLEGVPVLDLPTDRPRPAVQTFRGSSKHLALPVDLTDKLRAFSRQQGVTLFITMLTAFMALLSRYSGQEDVAVGIPVAGRRRVEVEGLIGFFVNTLVMRADLSGNPSVSDSVARLQEVVLGAQTHQDLPFEKIVEELQPERSMSRGPLFQVMFILNNTSPGTLKVEELAFSPMGFKQSDVKFDLTLSVVEGKKLEGSLAYNSDLFDRTTAERMAQHFHFLLDRMAADPARPLWTLPLLTDAEQHQALIEWNDSHGEYERGRAIHELIEAQVERGPDAVAIVYQDCQLSYAKLNARANQLAHYLARLGAGPEMRVALCVERSAEMVIGLLGVLKAGGAYVPMDPAYPDQRLAYMLSDSRAEIILSQQSLIGGLPETEAEVVCLDSDWRHIARESEVNLGIEVGSENLAYVIYTSGSTGNPKGVAVRHAGLVNFITSMAHRPGLNLSDVLIAVTSLSFDISMLEMYLPLVRGARTIVVDKQTTSDGARLIKLLTDSRATVMQATPATWRLLLESGWGAHGDISILCGGEALPPELADNLLDGADRIWNLYGPTETTIWSTMSAVVKGCGAVTIGRPIANTQVRILDKMFQPGPVGASGELCIGGDGVARGYLNRPDLTAEKFRPDPFAEEPGGRFYTTGDLVRYRMDGRIEFLGRIDHQVKVRGFRIELGEIESALSRHAGIEQAVVVALDDLPGGRRLVAYVVGDVSPGEADLSKYLHAELPDYMVPSAFVKMKQLPMTPNGKIDRKALPRPDLKSEALSDEPCNPLEEILCGIWAEVLQLERVGAHQNFFESGGHSLLAARVVSRVRDVIGVEVALRALFEGPTVAALAKVVERQRNADGARQAPLTRTPDRGQGMPLSYAQQRLWFVDKLTPGSSLYNIPAAIRFAGPLNVMALLNGMSEIVRRHEALRTRFVESGERFVQVAVEPQPLELTFVDLSGLTEAAREAQGRKLTEEEAQRPFDLPQGPHLRFQLLKIDDQDHIVLLTMHHIVSDGWSTGLLIQEVTTLYRAFIQGLESTLRELDIQYADFAAWQRRWLEGEVLEAQLEYWRRQLGGQLPQLNMPTDRPRPTVPSHRGNRQGIIVSKQTTEMVKALTRREGTTLFMTLLAAFDVLLHCYTGQDDLIVGTDVAGRSRSEIEPLIGFFINQLVMRVKLSGDPTFQELLVRVREVSLGAYANQDVPFDKLVEVLRPERALNRAPLFQVKLVLQNIPMLQQARGADFDGRLKSKAFAADLSKFSKLDMNLVLLDTAQGILCSLEYNTDLFNETTVCRFLKQFEMILARVTAQPATRLSELVEHIGAADRRELISRQEEVKQNRRRMLKNLEPKPISGLKKNEKAAI
jgi:amino acid adenylation domain-containing protein